MINEVRKHLLLVFPKTNVDAMLKHYVNMTSDFQTDQWEEATVKGGKFVEAALKAIAHEAKIAVGKGKDFKAGNVIDKLVALPKGTTHESLRTLLPRACRLVYEIASNRGARHDPDEVDSNESDATVVLAACSWMCGEMIRVATSGTVSLDDAQSLVDGLAEKTYPVVEVVDGRIWFHGKKANPRAVAVVLLHRVHPKRMPREDLWQGLRRHGASKANADTVIHRLKANRLADEREGHYVLLAPGRKLAEEILRGRA